MTIKFNYNAPVVLTFSIICGLVLLGNILTNGALYPYVTLAGHFNFNSVVDYVTLFSYTFGHADITHLLGNMALILLIGPIIEEKYGPKRMILMMAITALVTAILHIAFFKGGLMGASGLAFMMIMLISFVNVKDGKIPITFILILAIYLGQEMVAIFRDDNISQFAHILGGICGSLFGFTKGLKST